MIHKTLLAGLIAGAWMSSAVMYPSNVYAQDNAPPSEEPRKEQPALFAQPEMESIVAPIALYPDQLLSQILMAATYPLEVIQAARWIERPENEALRGAELAETLQKIDWDPSVKSLVQFPEVLKMLNSDLLWLGKVGDAFALQEGDIMNAVQRLRQDAYDAGTLKSDERLTVTVRDGEIIIEASEPGFITVKLYDPAKVFRTWRHAAYPPVAFPSPVKRGRALMRTTSYTYTVEPTLWDWHMLDWRHRRILITDHSKYRWNNLDRITVSNTWRHDPRHRRGVGFAGRIPNPAVEEIQTASVTRIYPPQYPSQTPSRGREPRRGQDRDQGRSQDRYQEDRHSEAEGRFQDREQEREQAARVAPPSAFSAPAPPAPAIVTPSEPEPAQRETAKSIPEETSPVMVATRIAPPRRPSRAGWNRRRAPSAPAKSAIPEHSATDPTGEEELKQDASLGPPTPLTADDVPAFSQPFGKGGRMLLLPPVEKPSKSDKQRASRENPRPMPPMYVPESDEPPVPKPAPRIPVLPGPDPDPMDPVDKAAP